MSVQSEPLAPEVAGQDEGPVLLSSLSAGVLRLTMNRPRSRNPLSEAMLSSLQSALDDAAVNKDVRAIVIASEGPGFCGGHDLKQMTARRSDEDGGRQYFTDIFAACATMMQTIVSHPKVIIAQVQGIATAAGCQLVAACDLAIASTAARFGVNGINSGLFCSTPMVALSRNIGRKRAMELLTLGEMLSAAEALEAGLVNQVVAPDELQRQTDEMAARLAARPSAVLALGKQAFYAQIELPLAEAYELTSKAIVDNMMMADAREGIGAFIDKRDPKWTT
ncbi:MAG: enoyl-CoA hydratase [Rhizobiales bacterium]|nr:enoyl-CoA hydratase [Hyphomicrobiales bacterium]